MSPTLHLTDSSAPSQNPPQIQSLHFPAVTGNQPLIPFNPQVLQEFTTAFDNSCMSSSLTHHTHLPLNQILFFLHSLLRVVQQSDAPHWRLAVHRPRSLFCARVLLPVLLQPSVRGTGLLPTQPLFP